jgi:SpoVK/Ycf46/Vps4 family AAA+-type ATPase
VISHARAGKTLLARAIASNIDANFLKVVSSAIVDKYIGESARIVREMFGYAREHQPCVIFMDEVDAIGGRRFSEGEQLRREHAARAEQAYERCLQDSIAVVVCWTLLCAADHRCTWYGRILTMYWPACRHQR